MHDDPRDDEDQVLELTEEQQIGAEDDQQHGEDSEGGADGDSEQAGDDAGGEGGDDDDEETVVSFGDAPDVDQDGDSGLIRDLRKRLREANERVRATERPAAPARELRPEPTSADHAFDDDAFKEDYKAWLEEKREIEGEQQQRTKAQEQIQREWEADVQRFETEKSSLGFDDLGDASDVIASSFNLAQQAVIVKAAEKPALLMYALAKAPAKLAELAKIQDVIKLAAAIAKVEGSVKVTKRRKGPALDRPQRGSGAIVSSDKKLAELEKRAEATGNRTELVNYRREMAKRAKKK